MTLQASLTLSQVQLGVGDPAMAEDGPAHVLRGEPGIWKVFAELTDLGEPRGERVRALTLIHGRSSLADVSINTPAWQLSVESGLLGVYDATRLPAIDEGVYGEILSAEYRGHKLFTLDDRAVIVRPGVGDGVYPLFIAVNAVGHVFAAKAVFLETPFAAIRSEARTISDGRP